MASLSKTRIRSLLRLTRILLVSGVVLLASGVVIGLLTFYPVIREEVRYVARQKLQNEQQSIIPIDPSFGIVIPKLGANARVIKNVNPYDSQDYQVALTQGVAHAQGTVFPGDVGNIFLFSHSSVNFYEAIRYNSVFYLISKLEAGDMIDLYYKGQRYVYTVTKKITVEPQDTSYLTVQTTKKQLTLMTCWPPGTTLTRLIVIAELTERPKKI